MPNLKNSSSILYPLDSEKGAVEVVLENENIWLSQDQMALLFEKAKPTISEHIKNIYSEDELSKEETMKKFGISEFAKKPTQYYSLDVIIAVGYRVSSKKATKFRIWASGIIKQYLKDGYAINEVLLRDHPEKLNKLAVKLRELRANEKNIYASVRECFKLASSDYKPSSKEVKSFYALLQDKFHHAVTLMTSSKLILERADHTQINMGLESVEENIPSLKEASTGKNYLNKNELYRLHLLSEQFLLYAESTALMGKNMTMKTLHSQLDTLLKLNGYPVFDGYKDYLKDRANKHAENEFKTFLEIKKLQFIGINVDLERFYLGEYDNQKELTSKVKPRDINKMLEDQLLLDA